MDTYVCPRCGSQSSLFVYAWVNLNPPGVSTDGEPLYRVPSLPIQRGRPSFMADCTACERSVPPIPIQDYDPANPERDPEPEEEEEAEEDGDEDCDCGEHGCDECYPDGCGDRDCEECYP